MRIVALARGLEVVLTRRPLFLLSCGKNARRPRSSEPLETGIHAILPAPCKRTRDKESPPPGEGPGVVFRKVSRSASSHRRRRRCHHPASRGWGGEGADDDEKPTTNTRLRGSPSSLLAPSLHWVGAPPGGLPATFKECLPVSPWSATLNFPGRIQKRITIFRLIFGSRVFLNVKYLSGLANIRIIPPREGGVSFMAKDKKSQDKKQGKKQDKAKKD